MIYRGQEAISFFSRNTVSAKIPIDNGYKLEVNFICVMVWFSPVTRVNQVTKIWCGFKFCQASIEKKEKEFEGLYNGTIMWTLSLKE